MSKRPHICLAEITRAYVDRPYALGRACSEGLDCFSFVYDYMARLGMDLPAEWRGLTLQSYADLYQSDPEEAKRIMVEFIGEHAQEIAPVQAFAGDILLLQLTGTSTLPFLAVHGGQTVCLAASPEFGVRPWDLHNYTIERAWRCRKPSLQ